MNSRDICKLKIQQGAIAQLYDPQEACLSVNPVAVQNTFSWIIKFMSGACLCFHFLSPKRKNASIWGFSP
jgi:hypothetical protein